jgi:hypothetical protein
MHIPAQYIQFQIRSLLCNIYYWSESSIIIIIIIMALQLFVGPWSLFQFVDPNTELIGLLGRGINMSQGPYLHTEQHKH